MHFDYSKLLCFKTFQREEERLEKELDKAAPHFQINIEESDEYLLKFEKYVSEQEVAFFGQKMDYSKIFEA